MRIAIEHRTEYRYSGPQRRVVQQLRLTPSSHEGQTVVAWRIDVDCDVTLKERRDGYGNRTAMLYCHGPLDALTITVSGEVLTEDRAGIVAGTAEPLSPIHFLQPTSLTVADVALAGFAQEIAGRTRNPLTIAHDLAAAIHGRMTFDTESTDVGYDAAGAFANARGVCQDYAHIFIAAARSLGLPARYVSGHLYRSDVPPDSAAAHAWAEVHIADLGWVAFDPTNGVGATEAYVRVAVGLDYRGAAPIVGARIGLGTEEMDVKVRVDSVRRQSQG